MMLKMSSLTLIICLAMPALYVMMVATSCGIVSCHLILIIMMAFLENFQRCLFSWDFWCECYLCSNTVVKGGALGPFMQLQKLQSPLVAYLLALQRMKYMYASVYNYFTNPVSVLFVCVFMSSSLSSSLLVIYNIYILY